jgi:hypothetical protein
MIDWNVVVQALIVAGITAVCTGYVSGKIMAAHLEDLTARIVRIEQYLNGLLGAKK